MPKTSIKRPVARPKSRSAAASSFRQSRRTARATSKTFKNNPSPYGLASVLDKAIAGILVLIFFAAPLFFTGLAAQGSGFEKMIALYFLVLVGAVVWGAKGFISGKLNFRKTPLDLPIAGLGLAMLASTIFSIGTKDSLIGAYGSAPKSFVAFLVFVLFYYLLVSNIDRQKSKIMFWSLICSISLITIYSFSQLFGVFLLPLEFTQTSLFNPIGSVSALAKFLIVSLPLLIIAMTQIKKIHPKITDLGRTAIKTALGVALAYGLLALAAVQGFVSWGILAIASALIILLALAKIIRISPQNLAIPLGVFILSLVFLFGNFNPFKLELPAEVSLSRSASWDIAKQSLKNDPLLGSGPGTFYYSFSQYRDASLNNTNLWNVNFDSATGAFFEIAATLGILGLLFILIAAVIGLAASFISIINSSQEDELKSVNAGLLVSFVVVILFAGFYAFSASLIIFAVLISSLAIAASLAAKDEAGELGSLPLKATESKKFLSLGILLAAAVFIAALFIFGSRMYLADIYAKESLRAPNIEDKIAKLNKASSLAGYQDSYYFGLANYYLSLATQAASQGDQASAASDLTLAIEAGKKAVEIAPKKADNSQILALIHESSYLYESGALERAQASYNKAIELEPSNPNPYFRLGIINMARAKAETDIEEKKYYVREAIKNYDQAIKNKGNFALAYNARSIAYEALGNIDEAINNLAAAATLDQNNLSYRFNLARLYFNRAATTEASIEQEDGEEIIEGAKQANKLSVRVRELKQGLIERDNDISLAEQLFLSILLVNQENANTRYSLALLYQKIGENNKAAIMARSLLNLLQDEEQKKLIRRQFAELL